MIIFLLEGPGKLYKAPIKFHDKLSLRTAFGAVNFAVLLAALLVAYSQGAQYEYETRSRTLAEEHALLDVSGEELVPTLELNVTKDRLTGWNIHLMTENFSFASESVGLSHMMGEVHAHLYINDRKRSDFIRLHPHWSTSCWRAYHKGDS